MTFYCGVCASPLFSPIEHPDVRLHAQSVNISITREFAALISQKHSCMAGFSVV
jgi:hypothetical protein